MKATQRIRRSSLVTTFSVLAIIGICGCGLEENRRANSRNNLKQIGIALHNYHDIHMMFPPGGFFGADDKMHHSWQTFVLPQIDRANLFNQIDFDVPWDDPRNTPTFQTEVPIYLFPGNGEAVGSGGLALSHYAGNLNVLPKVKMSRENHPLRISEIYDGTSNTMVAGEVGEGFKPWGSPANLRDPSLGLNKGESSFGRASGDGAYLLFCDGSVEFVRNDVDQELLRRISLPSDGQPVDTRALFSDGY
jgi:hypothetical protein